MFPGEYECRRHFGGSKPPKVEPVTPPPKITDPSIQAAAAKARMAAYKRRGRASTILGGGAEQAGDVVNQAQKDLLGG